MAAEAVYPSGDGADALQGQLFHGIKFWLSAKVPQRSRFINDIKVNGGEVVQLEKNADIKIVDHARKEAPPGTHSYTFVERSIRNRAVEDLANHAVGPVPGTIRSVGSVTHPPKLTRQKYTQEDERILWDWVNANPQKGGGTDGNEIYKQLELKHPQHPWQSWRDHYIKILKWKTRPIYPPNNAPPTPPLEFPTAESALGSTAAGRGELVEDEFNEFSKGDEDALLAQGLDILNLPIENITAAWTKWANEGDVDKKHCAERWQAFWECRVRPRFLKEEAARVKEVITTNEASSKHPTAHMQSNPQAASLVEARNHTQSSHAETLPRKVPPKQRSVTPSLPHNVQRSETVISPEPAEDVVSPLGNSILKRKRPVTEEIPSGSPPSIKSPPLARRIAKKRKEIASTPDQSPRRHNEERYQPLFLDHILKAEEDDILRNPQEGASSPLGQQPSESLSEPDRTARASTQALLQAATPHIDFEIPLPEGGWGGDEEADHADKSESESESEYDSAREQAFASDTQAILQGETQIPDLSIPDPNDPWVSLIPPSSPPLIMPSSPATISESSFTQQAVLDDKIDTLLVDRIAQGFSAEQIIAVLNSTCTDIPLTEQVLQQMGPQGGGFRLPSDVRGVWTAEDDRALQSSDAREVSRLDPKHGADNVNARYEWLELMAQEE